MNTQGNPALQSSEAKYRLLAEISQEMIYVISPDGFVEYLNTVAAQKFGVAPETVIGKHLREIFPRERAEGHFQALLEVARTRQGMQREVEMDFPNGRCWVEARLTPMLDGNGEVIGILGLSNDITERKRAEQVRDVLYQIGECVSTTENLDELLASIHARIKTVMFAENCYIALYDADSQLVSFPFFVDQYDPAPAPRAKRKGFTEYVLRSGKPLLLTPELYEELVESGEVEPIGTPPISWLGVPLFIEGRPYGALVVQSYEEGRTYHAQEQDLLAAIGHQAAMAIVRKRKDDALRLSEEKYRLLIDNIQDGVFVLQDVKIKFANDAFARILGYTVAEVLGREVRELIAPEDREMAMDRHRRRMMEEDVPREYELRGLHKDGVTRVYLNMTIGLITYRGRPAVMGTIKDISERKRVEQEREIIQRINQLLLGELDAERALNGLSAELLEIVPHETVALSLIQKEKDEAEYIVSALGEGLNRLQGENSNHYFEAYQGSLTQQILYDKREAIQDDLRSGATMFERHLGDLRMRSYLAVPLINAGVPLGMLFLASARPHAFQSRHAHFMEQIQPQLSLYIQHHRLIEKMFDSEGKYRNLFESSNDVIYILQDRRFIFVNRKFEEVLGYRLEEISKADFNFMLLVAPESLPIIEDRARRLAGGEKLPARYEFKGLTKSGKIIDFEANVSYISYDGQTATQGILRDISERKNFEARQQEMQLELIQRAKLSSIGMLSAGIAHNMNLPLQGIINHIELLKMTRTDVPYLDDILSQAQRIAAIINNMLFKSRQEQDHGMRELDLNQLLVEELTFLNADLEFKHRVIKEYHFDPDLPKIQG
ncbi:MAG TPA: PAS domain S-box protein, partial [bacterium]